MRRALLVLACGLVAAVVVPLAWGPPSLEVPPRGVELSGLTLLPPGAAPLPGRTLRVEEGTIVEISDTTSASASSAYAGTYVLPGLIDLHVHHPPSIAWGERELFALLFLRHGVTSVRDVGSFGGSVYGHGRRIREGRVPGPRLFACGRIVDGEPPGWPGARLVHDAEGARAAVAALDAEGSDCVKVYTSLSLPAFLALHSEAERRELPLVAHLPDEVPLEALRDAELQHLMGLDVEGPQTVVEGYVRRSQRTQLRHTPTLVAFARGARLEDYAALREEPTARLLPAHYRELLWNPEANPLVAWLEPAGFGALPQRHHRMQQTVAALHAAGVPVLAGTDTMNPFVVPGAALHEELHHLAAAGLSSAEVLAIATRRAGQQLGASGLGTLTVGAPADLVLFREDPTLDLRALDTLEAVVADGRLYPRAALDEAIREQLAYFDGAVYSSVYRAAARALIAGVEAWDGY